MMEWFDRVSSDPDVMRWTGAIVLSLLGFGFMRLRRHSMQQSLLFGGGILGTIVVFSLIKYLFAG